MSCFFDHYLVYLSSSENLEIVHFKLSKLGVRFSVQLTELMVKDVKTAVDTGVQTVCLLLDDEVVDSVHKLDVTDADIVKIGSRALGLNSRVLDALSSLDPQTSILNAIKTLTTQNTYTVRTVLYKSNPKVSRRDFYLVRKFLTSVSIRQLLWPLYRKDYLQPRHSIVNILNRIPLFTHFRSEINAVLKLATNHDKTVNLLDLFTLIEEVSLPPLLNTEFPVVYLKKFVIITDVDPDNYEISLVSCITQDYPSYLWRVVCLNAYPTIDVQQLINDNDMQYQFSLFTDDNRNNTVYSAIHTTYDDEIIVFLKGSDWLSSHDILTQLNKIYAVTDSLIVLGSHCTYDKNKPKEISRNVYDTISNSSYAVTGYAKLFKDISLANWINGNSIYDSAHILDAVSRTAGPKLVVSELPICVTASTVIPTKITRYRNSTETWNRRLCITDTLIVRISDWSADGLSSIETSYVVYDPDSRLHVVLLKRLICIANRIGVDIVIPEEMGIEHYYAIELGEHTEYVAHYIDDVRDVVGVPGVYKTSFLRQYIENCYESPTLICSIKKL